MAAFDDPGAVPIDRPPALPEEDSYQTWLAAALREMQRRVEAMLALWRAQRRANEPIVDAAACARWLDSN